MSARKPLSKFSLFDTLAYSSFFLFSCWLMFATFSYNSKDGYMVLAPIVQSDFAAHIPLIRSFSLGSNWPPEYPLYPGLPIQYHFLFYFLVGMLEKIGFRIDLALNSLSILGFFGMLAMTYAIGKKLFNDARVGLLSVIFFVFNGTLSFWYYFNTKESFSWHAFKKIFTGNEYASFGPWDPSPVLIFWNLNTYINQRHFCLAMGALLALVYVSLNIHNQKRSVQISVGIFFGLVFGFFPLLHKPVMLLAGIVMAVYFIAFPRMRLFLFVAGGVSLLVMLALLMSSFKIGSGEKSIMWNVGFLVEDPRSFMSYVEFFFHQFGFHCFLVPIGFLLASRQIKIIMIPAIVALIISFILKFSIDVSANHKLINFTIMMLQMLSAFVIIYIYDHVGALCWNAANKIQVAVRRSVNSMLAVLLLLLTFSGIMDLFVVINQTTGDRPDIKSHANIRWIAENTPKDSIFLNPAFIFDPASVAGRKIFLGYAYFIVSAGYDFGSRVLVYRELYTSEDPYRILKLLHENNIDYVEFHDEIRRGQNLEVKSANEHVYKKFFPLVFKDKDDTYPNTTVYKVPSEKEWLAQLSAAQREEATQLRIKNQGDNFIHPTFTTSANKLKGHALLNVDNKGNIYVMELSSSIIQKYSPDGALLSTFGSRGTEPGQTKDPNGFATDASGNVYVADTLNHRVQKFSASGELVKGWGSDIKLFAPNRIRISPDNKIYILDTGNQRVVQISEEGTLLSTFGSAGQEEGKLSEPTDMVIVGDNIYIAETGTLRLSVFDLNGKFIKSWPINHWELRSWNKFRLAWDEKNQRIYITNFITGKIFAHTKDGEFLGAITPTSKNIIDGISDVFVSQDQELFAYDIRNAQILKIHDVTPNKP